MSSQLVFPAKALAAGNLILSFALVYLVCAIFFLPFGLRREAKINSQIAEQESLIAEHKGNVAMLQKKIALIKKNPELLEDFARYEFGLIREGEHMLLLIDEDVN